jgi:hypothetical protein
MGTMLFDLLNFRNKAQTFFKRSTAYTNSGLHTKCCFAPQILLLIKGTWKYTYIVDCFSDTIIQSFVKICQLVTKVKEKTHKIVWALHEKIKYLGRTESHEQQFFVK